MKVLFVGLEFFGSFEVMEVSQFFLEHVLKHHTVLLGSILDDGLLKKSIFVLILINTLDIDRQACQHRRLVFFLFNFGFSEYLIKSFEFFSIDVNDSCCKLIHFMLLNLKVEMVVVGDHWILLIRLEVGSIVVFKIVLFVGETVGYFRTFHVRRKEHFILSIDKIICTSGIDTLSLLENLFLDFFSDVEIVVFSPFLFLMVVKITVVVSTIGTAFVDQQRVQMIGSTVDLFVSLFDLFVDRFNLFLVLLDSLSNIFSILG